jgi:hypothetical protein
MQGLRVLYFVGFLWLVNFLAKTQRREDLKKNKSIPDGQVFRRGNRWVRLIAVLAKADPSHPLAEANGNELISPDRYCNQLISTILLPFPHTGMVWCYTRP